MGGLEGESEGSRYGAPGEGLLLLANPEIAIEREVGVPLRGDPDKVTALHEDENVGLAGVGGSIDSTVNGVLEVSECVVIVGVDKEGPEATIGVGLPGGGSPSGIVLGTVLLGPEVKGAEGERALGTSGGNLIPLGFAISGFGDVVDLGELDGEILAPLRIAGSSALLLEEGEGADPVRVAGSALFPVDEVLEAAKVGNLDGIALRAAGVTRRDGVVVFVGDVWMRLCALGTPERAVLDGVLVELSVRVESKVTAREIGGVRYA